jgi:phytoene dehydrogenase-like protein
MDVELDTLIVGAGLAGLTCARQLIEHGLSCRVFEASDRVGGRVVTDEVDGFRLDRGFQVFLTAYPEAPAVLDYQRLQLCPFEPGALVRYRGAFHRFADPWRRPQHLLATALSPVATLPDKLRVALFRRHTSRGTLDQLYQRTEQTTLDLLRSRGFSDVIISRFLRPFLGGVFLDYDLQTSSRMCEFVFRMFAQGEATVPAAGMSAIPQQLAAALPADTVTTNCQVTRIDGHTVELASGDRSSAKSIVIASEQQTMQRLLNRTQSAAGRSVSCLYFAADEPPIREPILVLNGDGAGPVNNLCVPSQLSPSFAPPGKSLVSATVLGQHANSEGLTSRVRSQLQTWFGSQVDRWSHLKTYDIRNALPDQSPPALEPVVKPVIVDDGVFVCGDYCDTASINGAMASGRRAADAVRSYLATNKPQA